MNCASGTAFLFLTFHGFISDFSAGCLCVYEGRDANLIIPHLSQLNDSPRDYLSDSNNQTVLSVNSRTSVPWARLSDNLRAGRL